ncbi:MAG: hypothetical protein IJH53_06705 [Oscillospiraceae bacterium]|nr:hypothetical protein [Oscillospiraceae bacterium]
MKRNELTSFYLEALLLIVAFVAIILVLTGVFGTARAQSAEARELTQAVMLASNAAEAVAAADSPEQAAAMLDEGGNVRISDGKIEVCYFSDGSSCTDGKGDLNMTVTWEASAEDPGLVVSRITVSAADDGEAVYTLETASFKKEAAE